MVAGLRPFLWRTVTLLFLFILFLFLLLLREKKTFQFPRPKRTMFSSQCRYGRGHCHCCLLSQTLHLQYQALQRWAGMASTIVSSVLREP